MTYKEFRTFIKVTTIPKWLHYTILSIALIFALYMGQFLSTFLR